MGGEDPLRPHGSRRGQAGGDARGGGLRIVELGRVFREEWGRSVAAIARATGDPALAEDAVQEAFEAALEHWGSSPPRNPGAWIMATARNRAIDHLRRERTLARKTELLAHLERMDVPEEETRLPDERLELIFACWHPALQADVRIPLTLRMVSGLTTAEIARAFIVSEPALAQRLSGGAHAGRAGGARLARADAPCRTRVGPPAAAPKASSSCWRTRTGRCGTGIGSRKDAACSSARSPCACPARTSCRRRSPRCTPRPASPPTPTGGRSPPSTPSSRARFDSLVVELNRAVAVSHAYGPEDGLAIVERIEGLEDYHLLHSTRAHLLGRLGRTAEARAAYRRALELASNDVERAFLVGRVTALERS